MDANMANIARIAADGAPVRSMLDLGCDAGGRTAWVAERIAAAEIHGIEIDEERARVARTKGVTVKAADLNRRFPYDDERFDLVISNQVIEHVWETDNFVSEALRVLRRGGRAVVSTENLSSWHNVAAQILGWQPFSLTNISSVAGGIGNPAAVHRGEPGQPHGHLRVMAPRGLREVFEVHGFDVVSLTGAGYFPLPAAFARLDVRHAVFLTIEARRPTS